MNVSELYDLTVWIDERIIKKEIIPKYQGLLNVLIQNMQPNQQKQPFENQKNILIQELKNISFEALTKDQITFLTRLNIFQNIGQNGINLIEDILYKNVIDIATSVKNIQEITGNLTNGTKISTSLHKNLGTIVDDEQYELENDVLIRISFKNDANISNVSDFKKWGNIWYEIGYGITLAHDLPASEIKIIGSTKGSIILELVTVISIATTISIVLLKALKITEKILDIKKKAEEIRGLKLKNDKIASELEKEVENEKKVGTDEIIQDVIKKLKIKSDGQGDKIAALTKAITNLLDFMEKGGEIDFVIPEKIEETEGDQSGKAETALPDFSELRIAFSEIRKLEEKIMLLEHKSEQG